MRSLEQALLDTEDQICNLLEILDEDGKLEKFEQELDTLSGKFDDWSDRVREELKRREVREDINRKEVCDFIAKYETRMEDLGYSSIESWKMLRDELDNRLDEQIRKMVEVNQL